jgi:hypothetical protein
MSAASIFNPAWVLARETARSPAALALLVAALLLDLLARALLPLAIAASSTRGVEVGAEIRMLLFGGLTLLALNRFARWTSALQAQVTGERFFIFLLSGSYLHLFGLAAFAATEWLLGMHSPALRGEWLLASLWLSTLGGVLALARLENLAHGLLFLALAWWVPALIHAGIPHAPWSADGILSMLVPQLLGLGYVSLERVHR